MPTPPISTPLSLRNRFGLGCVTFGRELDPVSSYAMMDFAWWAGWTMFDTAAAYGGGASEKIVGEWFARRSPTLEPPRVATKILPPYEPESLLAAVRASLERLQLACVDVLYLHQWHESALRAEVLAALHSTVEQGLVRALGASNFSAEQLERALELQEKSGFRRFRYLQNIHNYAVSAFDPPLSRLCLREGVEPIGYSPLGAGFLTGKYRAGVPPGTRFATIPGHQQIYFTPAAKDRLARLLAVAERTCTSPADLALAWAVRHPAVSLELVGGRSLDQLERALAAATRMPTEVVRLLDGASPAQAESPRAEGAV